MVIIYKGKSKQTIEAVNYFNNFIKGSSIEMIINEKDSYDYTDLEPSEIASLFKMFKFIDVNLVVKYLWKPWHRKTKAIYSKGLITINSRKITSKASLVGSMCHEFLHFISDISGQKFGHGDNSSIDKSNTVQYYVGRRVKEIATKMFDIINS